MVAFVIIVPVASSALVKTVILAQNVNPPLMNVDQIIVTMAENVKLLEIISDVIVREASLVIVASLMLKIVIKHHVRMAAVAFVEAMATAVIVLLATAAIFVNLNWTIKLSAQLHLAVQQIIARTLGLLVQITTFVINILAMENVIQSATCVNVSLMALIVVHRTVQTDLMELVINFSTNIVLKIMQTDIAILVAILQNAVGMV